MSEQLSGKELEKRNAGHKAAEYIRDGMVLGLGTGSTAYYAIIKAGELVRAGRQLRAVATSQETARIASENGIEILDINDADHIDLAIDGVDEIDPAFNAIKGGGGALFREKIIATLAKEVIWIMDSAKQVDAIGAFPLPVEVLPYGSRHTLKQLEEAGLKPSVRQKDGETFISDNGNLIVDLTLEAPLDIEAVRAKLAGIVGILEDGLFLNMCTRIIVGHQDGASVIKNPAKH